MITDCKLCWYMGGGHNDESFGTSVPGSRVAGLLLIWVLRSLIDLQHSRGKNTGAQSVGPEAWLWLCWVFCTAHVS